MGLLKEDDISIDHCFARIKLYREGAHNQRNVGNSHSPKKKRNKGSSGLDSISESPSANSKRSKKSKRAASKSPFRNTKRSVSKSPVRSRHSRRGRSPDDMDDSRKSNGSYIGNGSRHSASTRSPLPGSRQSRKDPSGAQSHRSRSPLPGPRHSRKDPSGSQSYRSGLTPKKGASLSPKRYHSAETGGNGSAIPSIPTLDSEEV